MATDRFNTFVFLINCGLVRLSHCFEFTKLERGRTRKVVSAQ